VESETSTVTRDSETSLCENQPMREWWPELEVRA
jgi:hypothetical protein